jgi:hypothetical protein
MLLLTCTVQEDVSSGCFRSDAWWSSGEMYRFIIECDPGIAKAIIKKKIKEESFGFKVQNDINLDIL